MSRTDWIEREKGPGRAGWMTVGELADYLGVSSQTVKRWHREGRLPAPSGATTNGWRLWSPEQVTEILRRKARVWAGTPWEGRA